MTFGAKEYNLLALCTATRPPLMTLLWTPAAAIGSSSSMEISSTSKEEDSALDSFSSSSFSSSSAKVKGGRMETEEDGVDFKTN